MKIHITEKENVVFEVNLRVDYLKSQARGRFKACSNGQHPTVERTQASVLKRAAFADAIKGGINGMFG